MAGYHLRRWSTLGRVIHFTCVVFIVFYVLFDVLDLDGSDFPTTRAPVNRTVVIVEAPKVGDNVYLPDTIDLWVNVASLSTESEYVIHQAALDVQRPLPLNGARAHGYRVALPRSSTADPSLSF